MARLLLIGLLLPSFAWGQKFAFQQWHDGTVKLQDSRDTLQGKVQYDLQANTIQFNYKNKLTPLTPRTVEWFEIFDQTINNYRKFYTLPYALTGSYKAPIFFELLTDGKLTVLCREHLETKQYSSGFYMYYNYRVTVIVYDYYLLLPDGKIESFRSSRKNWLEQMDDKRERVADWAKDNRLSFDDKIELQKIINYYNSMKR